MYYTIDKGMKRNADDILALHHLGIINIPYRKRSFLMKAVGQKWTDDQWHFYSAIKYRYLYDWYHIKGHHIPKGLTEAEKSDIREWFINQQSGFLITETAVKKLL